MSRDLRPGPELAPSGHGRAKGLISERSSGSRIDTRSFAPPPGLADVIESLWYGRWSLPDDAPHTTELLGDPCVHIVFEHNASRVVGVWTRRWIRTLCGRGFVRAAKLRAGATAAFFDRPAHALSNRLEPLPSLFRAATQDAMQAVIDPASDHDGLGALARFLSAVRRPPDPATPIAVRAVAAMPPGEASSVEDWAREQGLSTRQLQRLFRLHVGASPKFLLKRRRLQHVALQIERGQGSNLAELAAELGYADQAHLARDVRAAVGLSPHALRERLRRSGPDG
ncbi:MAG: helix-turn-helix transcriptional regulator [Myxococcales bacterium FL481]|nr:MAG: helix-turn-helix transcriptional regulator [Myxococcales bacterium FL481]